MAIEQVDVTAGPDEEPDRYRVIGAEGFGGESIVYRAVRNNEEVALKVLRADRVQHVDHVVLDWLSQLELLRSVRHPGVVRAHEAFVGPAIHLRGATTAEQSLYLVMEWVDGRDLTSLRAERTTRSEIIELLRSMGSIAAALDLMHGGLATSGQPVLHSDIKPDNVRIDRDGNAVLVDFGLSGSAAHRHVGGTPSFRAPEVPRYGNSIASDVYGFVATISFVVAGVAPAEGHASNRAIASALRAKPRDRPVELVRWLEGVLDDMQGAERKSASFFPVAAIVAGMIMASLFVAHWSTSDVAQAGDRCPDRVLAEDDESYGWHDPDGDCFDSLYELLIGGGDPARPEPAGPAGAPTQSDQIASVRVVVANFGEDPTSPLGGCDPVRWAEAATARGYEWADPDHDCIHSLYELYAIGSDPERSDSNGDGLDDSIDPRTAERRPAHLLGAQLSHLDRLTKLRRGPLDPDRTSCDPAAWARAARSYGRLVGGATTWDDPDGDCLTSSYETTSRHTDPLVADTDVDGVPDGSDLDSGSLLIPAIPAQLGLVLPEHARIERTDRPATNR